MTNERIHQTTIQDDVEVPRWLSVEFIENHMRKYYKNDRIKVCKFDVQSATANGENFASHIFRVKVDFHGHWPSPNQVILR